METVTLLKDLKEQIKECRKIINKGKNKENQQRFREANREEYNAKMLPKNKAYYQANKERLNKQRMINYHKQKERELLKDYLGESEKIDF